MRYLEPKPWDKNCHCFANGESKHKCDQMEDIKEALKLGKVSKEVYKTLTKNVKNVMWKISSIKKTIDTELNMDFTGPIRKQKLYGFDNFKRHTFLKLTFNFS